MVVRMRGGPSTLGSRRSSGAERGAADCLASRALVESHHDFVKLDLIPVPQSRAIGDPLTVDIRAIQTVHVLDVVVIAFGQDPRMLARDAPQRQHHIAKRVAAQQRLPPCHVVALAGRCTTEDF